MKVEKCKGFYYLERKLLLNGQMVEAFIPEGWYPSKYASSRFRIAGWHHVRTEGHPKRLRLILHGTWWYVMSVEAIIGRVTDFDLRWPVEPVTWCPHYLTHGSHLDFPK